VKTQDSNFPFELVPLSKEELQKLGLEVEESVGEQVNSNDWNESNFEESASEPEKTQKIMKVSASDPASIQAAKDALARIEASQNAEQLAEENADLKGKLGLIAEKELEKKRKELGAPDTITTPEELLAFEKGKQSKENSGSAPLNNAQWGKSQETDSFLQKPYKNSEEMVSDVRRMARDPANVNQAKAQSVLDKWLRDWEISKRENPSKPDEFPNPNSREELEKLHLVLRDGFLVSSDKDFDSFGRKKQFQDKNPRVRNAKKHSESE
jgi:hypothetical protein